MADRALYYPFIHVRDVNWLKTALLLFRQVRRMTPMPGVQLGDVDVIPFLESYDGAEPLLTNANIWSDRAARAQIELARRLREDAADITFVQRFGRAAALATMTPGHEFHIHQSKLHDELKSALRDTLLAWEPGTPGLYDPWTNYVQLHPRLGQAVMATLGVACATGEGLDVVGDERSGAPHDCLTRKELKDVYSAWLGNDPELAAPPAVRAEGLFEMVVTIACDITQLDARTISRMNEDREPIRRLMSALAERARHMAPMDPGKERDEQFQAEAHGILKAWTQDRANMSNYWKAFFGFGLMEPGGKFLEKMIGKVAEAAPAGAAGAMAGLALDGPLLASGAGLGIGVFTHAAKTYSALRAKDKASPYQYLTAMEKAGVVFRSEVRQLAGGA
jgi:hypothetical protein